MHPQPLLLFPANGNAVEALDCLGDRFVAVGFVDDLIAKQGTTLHGVPVYGREAFTRWPQAQVLAVPGSPTSFRTRADAIRSLGLDASRFATVVHPSARVSRLATIGSNVLLMAGVVVTSNATIGDHVCVLPNTVIHHDAAIGDWTLVGSNVTIAGNTSLGEACYIGSGTSIRNRLTIGRGVLVGMGSNLLRDVPDDVTVAGNPARIFTPK